MILDSVKNFQSRITMIWLQWNKINLKLSHRGIA